MTQINNIRQHKWSFLDIFLENLIIHGPSCFNWSKLFFSFFRSSFLPFLSMFSHYKYRVLISTIAAIGENLDCPVIQQVTVIIPSTNGWQSTSANLSGIWPAMSSSFDFAHFFNKIAWYRVFVVGFCCTVAVRDFISHCDMHGLLLIENYIFKSSILYPYPWVISFTLILKTLLNANNPILGPYPLPISLGPTLYPYPWVISFSLILESYPLPLSLRPFSTLTTLSLGPTLYPYPWVLPFTLILESYPLPLSLSHILYPYPWVISFTLILKTLLNANNPILGPYPLPISLGPTL